MSTILLMLASGILGFIIGTTIKFIKHFDNNYDFSDEDF
jgi:hypothetical protein